MLILLDKRQDDPKPGATAFSAWCAASLGATVVYVTSDVQRAAAIDDYLETRKP